MTVTNTTARNQYTATAGQTVFAYTFEVYNKNDLVVLQNDTTLAEGTNYTVSGVGSDSGGNITLTVGATAGDIITVYRDMALERLTDYQNSGDFLAAEVNEDFDRLWLAAQQAATDNDRAIVKPVTDLDSISMELPVAADRGNSFLSFDATGAVTVTAAGDPAAPSSLSRQQFTGDGSTTVFTLASAPGLAGQTLSVFIDGVYQEFATYTVAGTTLTFSEAPPLNAAIETLSFEVNQIGGTAANLVTYTPAGVGAVGTTVQAKLRESVSVKDFGAVGDGVTDDTAAIQAALAHIQDTEKVLTGDGLFLISDRININSGNVNMPTGVFKFSDSMASVTDNVGIYISRNIDPHGNVASSIPRILVFGVDGNKDNQSNATIGVKLQDMSAPLGTVVINARYCETGVQTMGDVEKLKADIHAFECGLALHELNDPVTTTKTPDENVYNLHANLCNKLFKQEGSSSSRVNFACENSTPGNTEYCVEIFGNKACALSGEIRGITGRGIHVNSTGSNLDVVFDDLIVIQVTSTSGEALYIQNCRTLSGAITGRAVDADNCAIIEEVTGVSDLSMIFSDIDLNTSTNYSVVLGSVANSKQLKRSSFRIGLFAVNVGRSIKHDNTRNVDVYCPYIDGVYELNSSRQDTVSLPFDYIDSDIEIINNSPADYPLVTVRGSFTIDELNAYSYGFEGLQSMCLNYSRTFAAYVENGFTPIAIIDDASTTDLTDATSRINTKGKHRGKQVYNRSTDIIVVASGADATDVWNETDGTLEHTPV